MRTCVSAEGTFVYGIHKPAYSVRNLRSRTRIEKLGTDRDGTEIFNHVNYPEGDVMVERADWIYEIANPLPFRGTTYIGKAWADRSAAEPERIRLPKPPELSLGRWFGDHGIDPKLIDDLPRPLLLGLAVNSTAPEDLVQLARKSCRFEFDEDGHPLGLGFSADSPGRMEINDFELYEAVANNPSLPDEYKIAMVIRPGAQGDSEIVGDFHNTDSTHIYEYLRRNSYIGGGHYASNMADDAIRYRIEHLSEADIFGLRHLYYQRSYVRLSDHLGIDVGDLPLADGDLEALRLQIVNHRDYHRTGLAATLWGWNFGFDFSSSGYRLHASHQQIHQQYAIIPDKVEGHGPSLEDGHGEYRPFSSGDMVEEVIESYRLLHRSSFFNDYLRAIYSNTRMDDRQDLESDLIVWQDEQVLLFVPKAQTSQWELQLMPKADSQGSFPGNIIETDLQIRRSLDLGLLKAQQALAGLGAAMVTTIEYSKRFSAQLSDQPLLYSLMPKLPHSPGAFSESQLRFINGHYPEDFAMVCRRSLAKKEV